MQAPSDEDFAKLVGEALDELPEKYVSRLNNVLITYEDEPTSEQRVKLKLRGNQSLFGLYEGIPLTQRGNNYNLVLPDKITVFKLPLFYASMSLTDLKAKVKHTLWHEIAHYFGLGHDRIHELEDNRALQE
jgi:predicted Zn-dependent protease with MMP-like domain